MQLEKEAVNPLDVSSTLLLSIIDTSSIGMIGFTAVKDSTKKIVDFQCSFVNNTALLLLDRPLKEIEGKSLEIEFAGSIESSFSQTLFAVAETGKKQEKEFSYTYNKICKRLKSIFFKWNEGIIATIEEVSSRDLREERLTEEKNFLKQIAESPTSPIYIFDLQNFSGTYFNPHLIELTGYKEDELKGFGENFIATLVIPQDTAKVNQHFNAFFTANDQVREIEYRINTKSGETKYLKEKASVLKRNTAGIPTHVIAIIKETTEAKIPQDLASATVSAAKVANITSHELKKINKELEDRVKAGNNELVLSENRYRSLALATSSIVWMTNGVGEMEVENKLWESYTGQIFDEYKKFGWLRVINPEDRKSQKNLWATAFKNKRTIDTEFRLKRSGGQYRHMQVRVVPILDDDNNLIEWIGTCADIHDKKVVQAALIESEKRYEIAMKVTNDVVWDWNLITNVLSYTENYFSYFGYNLTSYPPTIKEWYNKIHPEDRASVIESIEAAIKNGETFWYKEYRHLKADGDYAFVMDRGYIIHDSYGKAVRMVGALIDNTKRKIAEQSLKESEANLKEAQTITKLGNWTWDLKTNNISWSKEMYNIYELSPGSEEPSFQTLQKMHFENALLFEKISNAINYGTSFQVDTPIKTQTGAIKYVQTIGKSETDEMGSCIRLYGTSMDITERKKTEEQLEQMVKETQSSNQKLVKMNEVLDNFVYAAAHDLRSPVANLKLILSLIQSSEDILKIKNHLKDFNSSINRLDNTIKGLVDVIEIQSNQEVLCADMHFNEVIDNIREELKNEIEAKQAIIITDLKNCKDICYIEAYLQSILRNLISNSLKYSREGVTPEIKITTDKEGEYVKLIIEDNGIGMDLERYGKNLFKPFTRFARQVDGKGLGLHLIKNIIEKNDGKIKVISHPNQGSTFVCYLKEYRN
ncbi:MAG TPA: PAS domain-containing protein [Cytophagales bacterium]|nr:PAS domain-containing protein [Cytophagales bacterium]